MILVADTGALYALYDAGDEHHAAVKAALEAHRGPVVVPSAILSELDYLLREFLAVDADLPPAIGDADMLAGSRREADAAPSQGVRSSLSTSSASTRRPVCRSCSEAISARCRAARSAAARRLDRSRTDVIRQAVEYYLDDLQDLRLGLERLQDPADPILDWQEVRRELLAQD